MRSQRPVGGQPANWSAAQKSPIPAGVVANAVPGGRLADPPAEPPTVRQAQSAAVLNLSTGRGSPSGYGAVPSTHKLSTGRFSPMAGKYAGLRADPQELPTGTRTSRLAAVNHRLRQLSTTTLVGQPPYMASARAYVADSSLAYAARIALKSAPLSSVSRSSATSSRMASEVSTGTRSPYPSIACSEV